MRGLGMPISFPTSGVGDPAGLGERFEKLGAGPSKGFESHKICVVDMRVFLFAVLRSALIGCHLGEEVAAVGGRTFMSAPIEH